MPQTDYLARAKKLMQGAARKAALVIVPLAAAVQSEAAAILPTSNPTCSGSDDGLFRACVTVAEQLPAGSNGITGVKLYSGDSGSTLAFLSGGLAEITMGTSDFVSGSVASGLLIPLAYSFSISGSGAVALSSWNLTYTLSAPSGGGIFATTTVSSSGGAFGPFSGTANMVTSGAFTDGLMSVQAILQVDWSTEGGALFVTIPSNSIDFNAIPANDVPEPASAGLMVAGLAVLGWRLVRRRRDGQDVFELHKG
ncbi:MAG: PEP-CTERM sorting domain-containing protein [Bryobacterales bacterium]|nr:PEP-CTERM sorting domain-containing protein [Bryobacterales bacterium]